MFGRRDLRMRVCVCGKEIKGAAGFSMHIKSCEKAKAASAEAKAVKEAAQ